MWLKTEGGREECQLSVGRLSSTSPRTHVIFDLGVPRCQYNIRVRMTKYSLGELIVRVLFEVFMPVVKLRLEGGNRQKTRRRCLPLRQRHTDRIQFDRAWSILRRNSGRSKSRLSDRDVHDLSRRPRQTLGSTHAIDGGDLSVSMARQLPSWGLETWIQYEPFRLVLRERTERDIDKPGRTGLRTFPVAHSADIPKGSAEINYR